VCVCLCVCERERERERDNFARRFADIATTLSSKTSIRPGNYQKWPVRPRGGLRQDSCAYFVYIELFFFSGLFSCYWYAGPPWRHGLAVVNWRRATESRVQLILK
jgi:hypothetical protein